MGTTTDGCIGWTLAKRRPLLGLALAALPFALVLGVSACDQKPSGASDPGGTKATTAKSGGGEGGTSHGGHAHGAGEGEAGAKAEGDPEAGHDHGEEHADEVVLTPEGVRNSGIRVARARKQILTSSITAAARVAYNSEQVAHVGSILKGRVAELKVRLGDTVQMGDALLVVDSPELGEAQAEYLQRRTTLETAKPFVELTKSALDRGRELYDKTQGISLTELQRREGEFKTAQGGLQSATGALTAADSRLQLLGMSRQAIQALGESREINSKYPVLAPLTGRVIEREVTLGELVGPEREKLLSIADLGMVWVLVDVPEAALGEVSAGSKVHITVAALQRQMFEGVVSYISPELDPLKGAARMRVEVKNPELRLMPGMFGWAEVMPSGGEAGESVVAVPEEAVQTVEGEPAVFVPVEGEPNTFAKRQIGAGNPAGGMVPVLAGLKEGEKYVVAGSFILKAELGKAGASHEH